MFSLFENKEKIKELEETVKELNLQILELKESNQDLHYKIINHLSEKNIENCDKLLLMNGFSNRFIFKKSGLYSISEESQFLRPPKLFIEFLKENNIDGHFCSLELVYKYCKSKGYFFKGEENV